MYATILLSVAVLVLSVQSPKPLGWVSGVLAVGALLAVATGHALPH
jgi:hypothetical protein